MLGNERTRRRGETVNTQATSTQPQPMVSRSHVYFALEGQRTWKCDTCGMCFSRLGTATTWVTFTLLVSDAVVCMPVRLVVGASVRECVASWVFPDSTGALSGMSLGAGTGYPLTPLGGAAFRVLLHYPSFWW